MNCECKAASECRLRLVRSTGGRTFDICSGSSGLPDEERQKYVDSWLELERKGVITGSGIASTPETENCSGCHQKKNHGGQTKKHDLSHRRIIGPGPCRYQKPSPLPFDGPITRHLIYHCWPRDEVVWKWNLDKLLKRIELFNGRRVISVAVDGETNSFESVQRYIGDRAEVIKVQNNPHLGEYVSFAKLLSRVESTDRNECVFYAHAKGGSRRLNLRKPHGLWPAIQIWANAMYQTNLDYWPLVEQHLEQYPITGAFRWAENVLRRRHYHGHHYSGAFYWFRSRHVFTRCWDRIEQSFYAAESWPGYQFKLEDSGNLMTLESGINLYHSRYWKRTMTPHFARWKRDHEQYRSINYVQPSGQV